LEAVFERLKISGSGSLDTTEAQKRLDQDGPNEIKPHKPDILRRYVEIKLQASRAKGIQADMAVFSGTSLEGSVLFFSLLQSYALSLGELYDH
jgi:hypothetical protein